MSNTVDDLFITKWQSEVAHQMQQTESMLRSTVTVIEGVGSSFSIPRMEASTAVVGKPRHQDLASSNVASDRVTLTIQNIHAPEYIDSLDALKTNVTLREAYTKNLVGAVNRAIDDVIIAALNVNPTVVTLPTANTLNANGVIALANRLNAQDVEMDGDRQLVISTGGLTDMLEDARIPSRDYMVAAYDTGRIKSVLGFGATLSNRLPVPSAGQRRAFAYHKAGVYLGMNQDVKITYDWVPVKQAYLIVASAAVGAVLARTEALFAANIAD